jgi:hypothetical protein
MNLHANDGDIGIIQQMCGYAVSSVLVLFHSNVSVDGTLAVAQSKWAEAVTRLPCIRETPGTNLDRTAPILIAVSRPFIGFMLIRNEP